MNHDDDFSQHMQFAKMLVMFDGSCPQPIVSKKHVRRHAAARNLLPVEILSAHDPNSGNNCQRRESSTELHSFCNCCGRSRLLTLAATTALDHLPNYQICASPVGGINEMCLVAPVNVSTATALYGFRDIGYANQMKPQIRQNIGHRGEHKQQKKTINVKQ